ncbi:MAG: RHS repeat-associated core domain-containing protein [Blastocatellia bacterium]
MFTQTFTHLVFTAADGTEFQLYDNIGDGIYEIDSGCTNLESYNRGRIFVTKDGSSATFISDIDPVYNPTGNIYDYYGSDLYTNPAVYDLFYPTGNLMLKDGTKYRIENGLVKWIRDSNGNKITFTYDATYYGKLLEATDSLNRKVIISYGNPDVITYIGFSGATRTIKIHWSAMGSALRPGSGYSIQTTHQLFPQLDTGSTYNPSVVSSIELPDSRRYYFYYNPYGEAAKVVLPTGGAIQYEYGAGIRDGNSSGQIGKSTYLVFYSDPPPPQPNIKIYRRLLERRVFPDGSTLGKKTVYERPERQVTESYSGVTFASDGYAQVDDFPSEAATIPLARSRHYFHSGAYGGAAEKLYYHNVMESYPDQAEGKEFKTELLDNTTLLQRLENVWTGPVITETKTTWISTNQVSKQTFSYDDYYNRKDIYEYDYGSGAPPTYATRHTHIDYLTTNPVNQVNYATDTNIHIRTLPSQQIVYAVNPANGAETWMAQTKYEYDRYDASANHAALAPRSNISGFDSGFTTSYTTRGNATQVDRWLNSSGSSLVSSWAQYDIAGNVVKAIDAKGYATIFDFSDRFGSPDDDARQNTPPTNPNWLNGQTTFAFATKITNALGHEAYTQFDYFLGRPVNSEDANGIVSSVTYSDNLDRPTQGIQARYKVGSGVTSARRQTLFAYNDKSVPEFGNPPRSVTTISDKDVFAESNNGNGLKSLALYDGLGRTWRGASYEGNTGAGNTWAITDTQFDALGRVWQVSNPYRAADPASASPPSGTWMTTTYDALSRVKTVQTPDTAVVTTDYNSNVVTVTDQSGKQRRSLTDALGRLIRLDEPNGCNNCLGSVSSPTQPTEYAYDALGNLRKVTQGTQTRWFAYDSLSRLIYAKNPEQTANSAFVYTDNTIAPGNSQWSIKYVYDLNGNLTEKTDARNIKITYGYDTLNRNTTADYDNTSINPDIYRFYDNTAIANGKGRFSHDYHGDLSGALPAEHKAIDGYDALGRPLAVRQHFKTGSTWSNGFITSQTYDLVGNVKTITSPSGRVVNYGYNTAGQLTSFTGKLGGLTGGGGSDVNYATAMQYNPRGQMIRETFGTNTALYQRKHYNRRGQLFDIRLGTDGSSAWDVEDPQVWQWANGSWNRGALRLYYSASLNDYSGPNPAQADNNGNLHRMDHFVPNALDGSGVITSWVMGVDAYTYDELNRLTQVTETPTGGTGPGFTQKFIYDRWGNRKIDIAATSNVGGGVTRIDFKVLTASNRLVAPSDVSGDEMTSDQMQYDKAGNLTYDNYSAAVGQRGSMTYDAENRMKSSVNNSHQYYYDADGKRTRRLVAGSAEMWLVYGVNGELVAEYDAAMPGGTLKKEYGYRGGQMLIVYDGTLAGDNQLKWVVTDHLGSTRMLVNRSGGLCGAIERRDYLPFGEELASTIGHRNATCAGYVGGNNPRQKFTGYERDSETGLDFAQARCFSSVQGRFTSTDPLLSSGRPTRPQSWNRYAYSYNNPLAYVDPTGMDPESDEERRKKQLEAEKAKIDVLNPGTDYTLVFLGIRSGEAGTATANAITDPEFSGTLGELGFGGLVEANTSILLNDNGVIAGAAQKANPEQLAMGVELGNYAMEKGLNVQVITHSNGIQSGADFFRQMGGDFKAGNTMTIAPATKQVDDLRVIAEKSSRVTLMTSDRDSVISKPWAPHRPMVKWQSDLKAFRNIDYAKTNQSGHGAQFYLREYKAGRFQR